MGKRGFYPEAGEPRKRSWRRRGGLLARVLFALAGGCAAPLERYGFAEPHMGCDFRIVVYAAGPEEAREGARRAFARIAELEGRLSDYDPGSEVSRLRGRTAWQRVSEDLWRNLVRAREVWRDSEGAFDVTLGELTRLWRRARRQGVPPTEERLVEARRHMGLDQLELDPETRSVRLLDPLLRLDLGGIAKGDALEEALTVLRESGLEHALVDGGGDIRVGAAPPGRRGWVIALPGDPDRREWIELEHLAVATSGDTERGLSHGGLRHSHILDPATGRALVGSSLVSVVAPDGALADAWASALSVLGAEGEGRAVLAGVQARILTPVEGRALERTTAGFPERLSSDDVSEERGAARP